MGQVVKKDGRKQAFNSSKIKRAVHKAAKEAGLSSHKIKELIQDVAMPVIKKFKTRARVKSSEIRRVLLSKLKSHSSMAAASWRRHDKKRKK